MLFFSYLSELKFRCLYCIVFFLGNLFISLYFCKEIIYIFVKPLLDINAKNMDFSYFIFTDLSEVFLLYFQVSIIISLFFSFIFLLGQFWFFLIQGLFNYEKNILGIFIILICSV